MARKPKVTFAGLDSGITMRVITGDEANAVHEAIQLADLWKHRAGLAIVALRLRAKRDLGVRATDDEITKLVEIQILAAEEWAKSR